MREIILMAFCSLLQNRRFCPTLETAVLSHFRNRRFCLIIKIGGFVSFSKSAVLSHSKIGGFVSHPYIRVWLPKGWLWITVLAVFSGGINQPTFRVNFRDIRAANLFGSDWLKKDRLLIFTVNLHRSTSSNWSPHDRFETFWTDVSGETGQMIMMSTPQT